VRGEVDWRPDEGDAAEEEGHAARPALHSGFATATAGEGRGGEGKKLGLWKGFEAEGFDF
jgi:hypothetical protein